MRSELLSDSLPSGARFPTNLVLWNLADTKRRNAHLGFQRVDADIQAFDRCLCNLVPPGHAARVAGDVWLAVADDVAAAAKHVVEQYASQAAMRVGWRCQAERAGKKYVGSETVETAILRGVRIVASPIAAQRDIKALAQRLADSCWGFPPNELRELDAIEKRDSERWCCVDRYPADIYCPCCQADKFEWQDGDSGVYSGDGVCEACGASVSFEDVSSLLGKSS